MGKLGQFAAACAAVVFAFGAWAVRAEVPVAYYAYLESNQGNATWTRLDFRPRGDSVIDLHFDNFNGHQSGYVFSTWGASPTDRAFTLYYGAWNSGRFYYGENNWNVANAITGNNTHKIRLSGDGVWINGTRNSSYGVLPKAFEASNQMILFAGHSPAGEETPVASGDYGNVRLRSMQCYNDGGQTLCADLYPCKDADGNYGLYDIVTRKIYRNLGTNGKKFAVGAAVTGPTDSIVVLSSDGRRYGSVTPTYGKLDAPEEGVTTFACSTPWVELVDKPGVAARCTGWKLYSVLDNSLVKSSEDAGAAPLSFTHDYRTGNGVIAEWQWQRAYRFRVSATAGGTVTHDATTNWYETATDVYVEATPASGYRFVGWRGASEADRENDVLSVTVGESPVDLVAVFERDPAVEQTAVYANAAAFPGGDGTSWVRAYTDIGAAIADANEKGLPLHVAGGVYIVRSTLTVTNIPAIYGGFTGTNDLETVADRQIDRFPTVLTGDLELNDCWAHVVPGLNGNFSYTYETLYDEPMVRNGALNLPPDFTGDYDLYQPHVRGSNTAVAMNVKNGVAGVIDGLYFTSFVDSYVFKFVSGQRTDLKNCRFLGNRPSACCVVNGYTTTTKTMDGCKILYNRASDKLGWTAVQSGIDFGGGGFTVKNLTCLSCGFLNEASTYTARGHTFMATATSLDWSFSLRLTMTNCRFERMYTRAGVQDANCGGLCNGNYTSMRFRDCSFVNMLSVVAQSGLYIQTFPGCNSECIGCSFEGNRYEVNLGSRSEVYLFGDVAGSDQFRHSYDSCSFVRNSVYAKGSTKTSGTVTVALLGGKGSGNGISDGHRAQFVNCVFDSNDVRADLPDGVKAVLCRGVWNRCYTANGTGSAGIANCTFLGPKVDGVYDVLQANDTHTKTFNIVNSVFQYTGGEPYTNGFSFAKPSLVKLTSCTLANYVTPDEPYAIARHAYDPMVFVTNRVGTNGRPVLVPAAVTPDFGTASDLVYNGATFSNSTAEKGKCGFMTNYAFRVTGDAPWQVLMTNFKDLDADVSKNPSKYVMNDACGVRRPLGGATRGAVQTPTAFAQAGATLTLRKEPFKSGYFAGPQVQCVAAGAAITPVEAFVTEGEAAQFAGWYTTNDVLYSSSARLEISNLDESLVLVARFEVPKTKIRFVLGPYATFDDTGLSTNLYEVAPGGAFPERPTFTVKPGWVFADWDKEFPVVAPDADTDYTARFVTTDLRIIRCVPAAEAGPVQDGLTWATAFGDVAAAYKEAAICRGEVWVKAGRYLVKEIIPLKSNVAVRGGFAGDETSADEADPAAHPTVITGDTQLNDYWKYKTSGTALLWQNGVPVGPEPDWGDNCYAKCANAADDTVRCFSDESGAVTNVAFYGLTFACFGREAVRCAQGTDAVLAVSNCQFIACSGLDEGNTYALTVSGRRLELLNSRFVGNCGAVLVSGGSTTSVVARCAFDANCRTVSGAAGVIVSGSHAAAISQCDFRRSYAFQNTYYDTAGSLWLLPDAGWTVEVSDCSMVSNSVQGLPRADVYKSGSGAAVLSRCRFDGIRFTNGNMNAWTQVFVSTALRNSGGDLLVRDSSFSRCSAVAYTGNSPRVSAAVCGFDGGVTTFVNDTFDDCTATSMDVYPSGIFAQRGENGKVGIVNCLFNGMKTAGDRAGFFATDGEKASTSFNVINSAIVNSAEGFKVAYLWNNAACLGFADSVVDGFDADALPSGSNGYAYNVTTNTTVAVGDLKQGENGAWARAVTSEKRGRRVWLKGTTVYFRDDVANPAKPWRKAADKAFFAAEVDGLDASALIPDAFGKRRISRCAFFGPAFDRPGLMLIVR